MGRPLHVGLNLIHLTTDSGGTATYARELSAAMVRAEPATRITAWLGRDAPPEVAAWPVERVRLPFRSTGSPVHIAYELLTLGAAARRQGVDVVHGMAYAAPVARFGVPTVVTLHDLTWRHLPASVSPRARVMFELLARVCGRRSDRVIAISRAARDDLVATLGLDAAKIDVTLLGAPTVEDRRARTPQVRAMLQLPQDMPIVLCVGQFAAHKNYELLVEGIARVPGVALVMCGRSSGQHERVLAAAARHGIGGRVRYLGYVAPEELEQLYGAANAAVLPSTHEGFGLPLAEAMARGVPMACSRIPVLVEVAAGSALHFDPHSAEAIAEALRRVVHDRGLRAELARRGRARARELTWDATARATLHSYRLAISQSGRCTSA